MNPCFIIKPAEPIHIPSINVILTHYALNTVITFATTGQTDESFLAKFRCITEENNLPFLVAVTQAGKMEVAVGYTYISPWRPERAAYQHTGELSLFVHPEHQGKGIGSALLRKLLEDVKETRAREVLAVMAVDKTGKGGGLGLRDWYVRLGFREVGKMDRVGWKFGRW